VVALEQVGRPCCKNAVHAWARGARCMRSGQERVIQLMGLRRAAGRRTIGQRSQPPPLAAGPRLPDLGLPPRCARRLVGRAPRARRAARRRERVR
jgi:hypothetical protein